MDVNLLLFIFHILLELLTIIDAKTFCSHFYIHDYRNMYLKRLAEFDRKNQTDILNEFGTTMTNRIICALKYWQNDTNNFYMGWTRNKNENEGDHLFVCSRAYVEGAQVLFFRKGCSNQNANKNKLDIFDGFNCQKGMTGQNCNISTSNINTDINHFPSFFNGQSWIFSFIRYITNDGLLLVRDKDKKHVYGFQDDITCEYFNKDLNDITIKYSFIQIQLEEKLHLSGLADTRLIQLGLTDVTVLNDSIFFYISE